jgi:hypothetical protein
MLSSPPEHTIMLAKRANDRYTQSLEYSEDQPIFNSKMMPLAAIIN